MYFNQKTNFSNLCLKGFLNCSCKTYERFGYPCHHLLHVLQCNDTSSICKEWIHIRWSKEYVLNYLHNDTEEYKNKLYEDLFNNQPCGIKYTSLINQEFPIYRGFSDQSINTSRMFDVPDFQFMSQTTKTLWIENNRSSCPELHKLMTNHNPTILNQTIVLSQSQTQSITKSIQRNEDNNDSFHGNNDSVNDDESIEFNSINPSTDEITDYSENFGLFKRAFDLAGNNVEKHRQLYNYLSNFVIENEINHSDNDDVIANRMHTKTVSISSNKVVNKTNRSNKRKKGCWEI